MAYFLSLRLCFQEMMSPTLLPALCILPFLLPPPPLPVWGDRLPVPAVQKRQMWASMIHAFVGQYTKPKLFALHANLRKHHSFLLIKNMACNVAFQLPFRLYII